MPAPRQYAVLGPLTSAVEARAFLGCEVAAGVPNGDLPVVIVWLPDDVTKDPKQIARLQRETAFVTQLVHPNILRVHGLEAFEEGWARIVAFVDGETLQRVYTKSKEAGRKLDPRVAARIIVDACEGVHHAHEEGLSRYAGRPIVHGGLRPDTLFVGYDGVTKVTGFGASIITPTQHGGSVRDKYAYLAPEQIIGGKATASPATDIYALGAILFELLSGRPPFADATDIERAVLTGDPPTLDEPGLVGRLGNIAATALAKRGSDRFENVGAMRDAILTALAEEGVATAEEVSALVAELMPPESPERAHRRSMLESAIDPDSVTMLSRPPGYKPPPPPRRASSISASVALDPAEFAGSADTGEEVIERVRVARPREEKTIVDGRPPAQVPSPRVREPEPREPAAREDTEVGASGRPLVTGPIPTIQVGDDMPTDASVSPSAVAAVRAVEVERRELAELRGFTGDPVTDEAKPAQPVAPQPVSQRPVPVAPSLRDAPILAFQDGMVTDTSMPVMPPIAARPSVSARLEVDRVPNALAAFPDAGAGAVSRAPAQPQAPVIPPFNAPVNAAAVLGTSSPSPALPQQPTLPPPPFAQPSLQTSPFAPPSMAPPGGFVPPQRPNVIVPPGSLVPQPTMAQAGMMQPGMMQPGMMPQQPLASMQPGVTPGSSLPGAPMGMMQPGMPGQGSMPGSMMPGMPQPMAQQPQPGMMPGSLMPPPMAQPQAMMPGSSLPGVPMGSMQPGLTPGSSLPGAPMASMQPGMMPRASMQPGLTPGSSLPGVPQQPVVPQGRASGMQSGLPGSGVVPQAAPGSTSTPQRDPKNVFDRPDLLQNQPVRALGAVPRAPMREQSAITRFDRKAGDSSRSVLIWVLGAVALLLVGIFYFSEPPPDVKEAAQQEVRHNLPKEVVRAALENAKPAEKPAEEEKTVEEAKPEEQAKATKPGETPDAGPPVEKYGRIELSSDPAVDVYDGSTSLGRTPLTAKLESGSHQLRFTDKTTGLNVYRTYKVKGGGFQRDHLSFGTAELVVEAPDGASVLLNSRFVGKAPIEPIKIYEGKYILKVTLDGKSWSDVFDAPPGRRINYKVTLNSTK